jgi:hypothetical protein
MGLAVVLAALTDFADMKIPTHRGSPITVFFMALGLAAVFIILVSLVFAAIQYRRTARHGILVPRGWSAIVDGGTHVVGTRPVFAETDKGTLVPPDFEVVKMGPGVVTDDMGNTIANRVWYRGGSSSNVMIG